jgi:hypothetical protein
MTNRRIWDAVMHYLDGRGLSPRETAQILNTTELAVRVG